MKSSTILLVVGGALIGGILLYLSLSIETTKAIVCDVRTHSCINYPRKDLIFVDIGCFQTKSGQQFCHPDYLVFEGTVIGDLSQHCLTELNGSFQKVNDHAYQCTAKDGMYVYDLFSSGWHPVVQ